MLQRIYEQATELAIIETRAIERAPIPKNCPWSLAELLEG
jgi:hypothetical protein